jgi:HEPN domain-containing protein
MRVITQKWLDFASKDVETCWVTLQSDNLTNIVAFHAQQAVEKCFKAIIEEGELNLPRIHDLTRLYNFSENSIDFEVDTIMLNVLDSIYTASRYPGDIGILPDGNPSKQEAEEMYEFAKQVYKNTLIQLNNE